MSQLDPTLDDSGPSPVLDPTSLEPVEMECMRCGERARMRFYGMCTRCRDEVRAKYDAEGRDVEVGGYEPKMNVTPNAVALKD